MELKEWILTGLVSVLGYALWYVLQQAVRGTISKLDAILQELKTLNNMLTKHEQQLEAIHDMLQDHEDRLRSIEKS